MALALVRYAGYDEEAEPGVKRPLTPEQLQERAFRRRKRLVIRAYTMFKAGKDTADIAVALDRKESTVLRWVSIARSWHKKLPVPYEARK